MVMTPKVEIHWGSVILNIKVPAQWTAEGPRDVIDVSLFQRRGKLLYFLSGFLNQPVIPQF